MKYRVLGQTGIKVSVFSYGSWITFTQLAQKEINKLVEYAFENGINQFDTAEVYAAGQVEEKLGDALQQLAINREKYLISTKVFWGGPASTECGLTRKHIIEGCNRSLQRLKLDYIDFYSCHRPDKHTPILETIIAMNMLIQQGKILYWGTSEWPNELIIEAYHLAYAHHLIGPSVEQFEYNLFCREKGEQHFPALQKKIGIGACAVMPFACGILAGRYNEFIPSDSRASLTTYPYFKNIITTEEGKNKIIIARKLADLANKFDISLTQLVLYWCLANQAISTIILGTTKIPQLAENLQTLKLLDHQSNNEMINEVNSILNNTPMEFAEPSYEEVVAES